ncbi:MAG TPA: FAD-dependent oxidoreductase [Gaiellaceae bacterium]|nr:FAD-dependent oxidoreductase [Gaiellaceae bacterium]
MADSFWLEEPFEPIPTERRTGRVDVAVVGAGVTGLSCALELAEGGRTVRVHEARTIASGASGRNGGFALRGGAMPYQSARDELGPERAKALWVLTEQTLDRMGGLAGDALRRVGSLRLAADEQERDELRAEYDALETDGFAAEWIDEPSGALERRYHAALLHPRDGALQPARWIRRLAGHAAAAGAELREHERVESLEALDADAVVVASDGYPSGLLPAIDEIVQPTRGQVIVTEPLPELLYGRPHYARRGFDYWQQLPDRRLVLGGRRDVDLEAEATPEEATTPEIQSALEQFAAELVGVAPTITHRWSGIFGSSPDELPLVGPVPGHDGVWVSRGYSGHGNVLGLACGRLIARAILGHSEPELELFDPARFAAG